MISGTNVRETCQHCDKQIYTHNPILICPSCNKVAHNKCADALFAIGENGNWYCHDCVEIFGVKRYNPFSETINLDSEHDYDVEPVNSIECITKISNILETCQPYNAQELNSKLDCSELSGNKSFSTFLYQK